MSGRSLQVPKFLRSYVHDLVVPVDREQKGFTLIELLVVVSITTMIVAILLPALGAARESARAVQCASNARQIGLVYHMYGNDYDDWIVPSQMHISPAHDFWYELIAVKNNDSPNDYGLRYRSGDREVGPVFYCPSEDHVPTLRNHFGTNTRIGGRDYEPTNPSNTDHTIFHRYSSLSASPSRVILVGETNRIGRADDPYGGIPHGDTLLPHVVWSAERHGGDSANIIYADGHVERKSQQQLRDEVPDDPSTGVFKVGRRE